MSRVAPTLPGSNPAAATVEARLLSARGQISPLYRILLNSVEAADGWEYFLTIVRQKLSLSPRLREILILRIAVINQAPYEFEAHIPHARAAGVSDAEIDALRASEPQGFERIETLVIAYADAMTRNVHVPDALAVEVQSAFPPRQFIDLTVTIAAYNMVSRVLCALDIR